MSRSKIHKTAPTRPTYHLADRLCGRAIDSLYTFTEGLRTLAPLDDLTVTILATAHPWGYSAQLHAVSADGQLQAAAEATAAHPLPAGINSRIRSFRSGPLTWHHAAGRITNSGIDHTTPTVYVASGAHHYELARRLDMETSRDLWDLTVDGQPREHAFAGPLGATDFVANEYEAAD
jgi:hypothetical protein